MLFRSKTRLERLPKGSVCDLRNVIPYVKRAPVAQLDRAVASGATGREFESLRAHHNFSQNLIREGILRYAQDFFGRRLQIG